MTEFAAYTSLRAILEIENLKRHASAISLTRRKSAVLE